jgi:hypothetical protein
VGHSTEADGHSTNRQSQYKTPNWQHTYHPQAGSTFGNVGNPAVKTGQLGCYKNTGTSITPLYTLFQACFPTFLSPQRILQPLINSSIFEKHHAPQPLIFLPGLNLPGAPLRAPLTTCQRSSRASNGQEMLTRPLRYRKPISDDTILLPGWAVLHRSGLYHIAHGHLRSVVSF